MKGKWVWSVIIQHSIGAKKMKGNNSVYANREMADRKRKRILQDSKNLLRDKRIKQIPKVWVQKIMYFKDKVKENTFDDYCSICGGHLMRDECLEECYKPSTKKP